jgi:hypothetical protein
MKWYWLLAVLALVLIGGLLAGQPAAEKAGK